MIQSKEDLKKYIEYESCGFSKKFPDSLISKPKNFQKLLRKPSTIEIVEKIFWEK